MKRLPLIAAALCSSLLIGVRLFHVGPFGVHPGDDVVLARSTLTNRVGLCVVAHRTPSLIEPYEVTLYRTEVNGETFNYWMGYEDSFWWGCSIRPADTPSILHIWADGSVAAVYNVKTHNLTFPQDYYHYGIQVGERVAGDQVPIVVAQNKTESRTLSR